MKQQSSISNVQIVPAEHIFFDNPRVTGKFVAIGIAGMDDPRGAGYAGMEVRTSLIETINIQDGYIETMNTIYKIV